MLQPFPHLLGVAAIRQSAAIFHRLRGPTGPTRMRRSAETKWSLEVGLPELAFPVSAFFPENGIRCAILWQQQSA
jgi:hypothetical protein